MATTFSGRKLWLIPQRGMIKGVCAGLAQYFDVPVKLVRLIMILSVFFGLFFFTTVAYIILAWVLEPMPEDAQDNAQPTRSILNDVDAELAAGERRLRAMERYVTSDAFTLRSRFRQL